MTKMSLVIYVEVRNGIRTLARKWRYFVWPIVL